MLNWFGKKHKPPSNVVTFPKSEAVPLINPPKMPEPAGQVFYRLGLTDNNRIAFNMGHSEITMNHKGAQRLVDQLVFYMNQLEDEGQDEGQGN